MGRVKEKIQDRMLLGSIYDVIMKKTKYKDPSLKPLYNELTAHKHRMLYYKMFKKRFLSQCTKQRDWESLPKTSNSDTVWIMWMQGFDKAPEIVKTCLSSIEKNLSDKKIVLLDESNIFDYILLPEHVISKWKAGIIGNAHFSDMVRLEILIKYGGYWIDSTVLCTDNRLFKFIDKQPLFMFSFYYFGFNPEIMQLNNWFIKSDTNNNILCLMREFLYEYWKCYDRAVDYFFFHEFLTIALEFYKEEYDQMPIVSQVDSHLLATYIYNDFNEDVYDLIKTSTGIHKLSTRFEEKEYSRKNCFYDVVIRKRNY